MNVSTQTDNAYVYTQNTAIPARSVSNASYLNSTVLPSNCLYSISAAQRIAI